MIERAVRGSDWHNDCRLARRLTIFDAAPLVSWPKRDAGGIAVLSGTSGTWPVRMPANPHDGSAETGTARTAAENPKEEDQ
jgi:hypothetical protein